MAPQPTAQFSAESLMPSGYKIAEVRQLGRRRVVVGRPDMDDVTGERTYSYSEAGLCVGAATVCYGRPVVESFPSRVNLLKVHVRLSGASRVILNRGSDRQVREMSFGALFHPGGESKLERFDTALTERSITVACSPEFLVQEYGVEDQSLPRELIGFLEGRASGLSGLDLPLSFDARRAAEVICDGSTGGAEWALVIESKALELLACFLDQAKQTSIRPAQQPLLNRDRRIADAARVLLEEHFADPPGLKEMARAVGTHTAKLMRVFKAVHGCTISDYLEIFRMNRARELVVRGDLPVTQIAYEVGYGHPSNFATAFRRHFGISPSDAKSWRTSAMPSVDSATADAFLV